MIRLAVLAALVVLAGSACGGSGSAHGGDGVVTAGGRVGSLQIDVSTRAAIVAFAGQPDSAVTSRTGWPGVPAYHALAYGCLHATKRTRAYGGDLPRHRFCRTVYYVNARTHRLVAFWTDSPAFESSFGTRPGMAQRDAERRSIRNRPARGSRPSGSRRGRF